MIQVIQVAEAVRSPVFLAHVLAISISLAVVAYALQNRTDQPGARWFALWVGATAGWIAVYTLALTISDVGRRTVVESLSLAPVPVAALAWFVFTLAYSGRWKPEWTRGLTALALCALALCAFLATNPFHGLVFELYGVETYLGVYVLGDASLQGGYWLFTAFVYGLYLIGVVILVDLLLSTNQLYRDQAVALVVAVCLPLTVATLVVFERLPVPINLSPLSFGVAAVPLVYAVFRSDLLDVVPASFRVGERRAVETIDQGVLVLDADDSVAFANSRVAELLEVDSRRIVGRDLEAVVEASPLEPAPNWAIDRSSGVSTEELAEDGGQRDGVPRTLQHESTGRTYEVMHSPIESEEGPELGRTLYVRDVTDERRRKQRLLVLNRVVRHNLRNDMNVLRGHVRLLEDEAEGESVEVIDEIASELIRLGEKAHQMDRIIQDASGAGSPVNVAGIVDRVVARYDEQTDVWIDVRGPAQAWTRSHGSVVEAIVENLVENAVEHASSADVPARSGGGTTETPGADDAAPEVSGSDGADTPDQPGPDAAGTDAESDGRGDDVETPEPEGEDTDPDREGRGRRVPDAAPVTVEVSVDEDAITLVVADDGPGIPEQEVATLMRGEVSALQHGSGIGLWMVKWCVDLTNATWTIESDDGARVTVAFPRETDGIAGVDDAVAE